MNVNIKKLAETATDFIHSGSAVSWGNHPIKLIAANQEAILNDMALTISWLTDGHDSLLKNYAVKSIVYNCVHEALSAAVYDITLDDCNDLGVFLTLIRHYISAHVTKVVDSINLPPESLPPGGYQKGLVKELGNRLLYASEFFNYMSDKGQEEAVSKYRKYRKDVSKQAVLDMVNNKTILGAKMFDEGFQDDVLSDCDIGTRLCEDEMSNQDMDLQTIGSKDEHVAKVVSDEEKELAAHLEKKAKSIRTRMRMNKAAQEADDDFDQYLI